MSDSVSIAPAGFTVLELVCSLLERGGAGHHCWRRRHPAHPQEPDQQDAEEGDHLSKGREARKRCGGAAALRVRLGARALYSNNRCVCLR